MNIEVNNITLHYETKGTGNPVLFLHGNGEDLHIFDKLTDALKSNYTTFSIDSRNHGKSTVTDSYSYDVMAEDIYQFIEKLHLKDVSIVGFSDGAIIALILALKYPKLISKMILAGINVHPHAFIQEIYDQIEQEYATSKAPLLYMMLTQPNIELEALSKMQIPSLVIYGENDIFTESSFIEINEALPNSELLKMIDHSHDSYIVNEDLLAPIISKFLS